MNSDITAKLLEYLNRADIFLSAETPEFINQYLTWCLYQNIAMLIIFPLVLLFLLILSYILRKSDYNTGTWIVTLIVAALTFLSIPFGIMEIVKIKTAPKVYLVENVIQKLQNKK